MDKLLKALKDIPVGEKALQHGANTYDYSHILEPHHQESLPGAKLLVRWVPHSEGPMEEPSGWLKATLFHDNRHIGEVEGDLFQKDGDGRKFYTISNSWIGKNVPREFKGRRLYFGRKLYEAAMAHAMNALGATHVGGGDHSTYASLAHRWLGDRHGMLYQPTPNTRTYSDLADPAVAMLGMGRPIHSDDWGYEGQQPQSYDDRYAPYAYTLKSELSKAEHVEHYDYDHLLPANLKDKGYRLEVVSVPGNPPPAAHAMIRFPGSDLHSHAIRVSAEYAHPDIVINQISKHPKHEGQNLQHHAFEALMAHMQNHGAQTIRGREDININATHRALANKYGMVWNMKRPGANLPQPSIAMALHKAVTTGSLEIPLAKEEVDPTDPIVPRIDAAISAYDSYALSAIMRETTTQAKHVAYMIKKGNLGGQLSPDELARIAVKSPNMNKEVYNEVTTDADTNPRTMQSRYSLLRHLSSNLSFAGANASWLFNEQVKSVKALEAQTSDSLKVTTENAKAYLLRFAVRNIPTLTEDQMAEVPLEHTIGDSHDREAYLEGMIAKYKKRPEDQGGPTAIPTKIKEVALDYAKKLFNSYEKVKNAHRGQGYDVISEVNSNKDTLKKFIEDGLPESYIKSRGRQAKNLFTAFIAQAPNYPAAKGRAIVEHFLDTANVDKISNSDAKGLVGSLILNSPHLQPTEWENVVFNYGKNLPHPTVINHPRFTMEFAKRLWDRDHDMDFVSFMQDAGKNTPEFTQHVLSNAIPEVGDLTQFNASLQELRTQAEANAARRAAGESGPAVGPYMHQGIICEAYDNMHPVYKANPYMFKDELYAMGGALGWENIKPMFGQYVERYKKIYSYLPPGATHNQMSDHFGRVWGQNDYYSNPSDRIFDIMYEMNSRNLVTPEMEASVGDFLMSTPQLVHNPNDNIKSFIRNVKDEGTIHNFLQNATHSWVINSLLGRADAKPEWLTMVEARPEFSQPPTPEDPRYTPVNSGPGYRYFRERGQEFHNRIRASIFKSPAFPAERIHQVVTTTTNPDDVVNFSTHQNLQPETRRWILSQTGADMRHKKDENGHYMYHPTTGAAVMEQVSPGTVPWDMAKQHNIVYNMVSNNYEDMSAEDWEALDQAGYYDYDASGNSTIPGSLQGIRRNIIAHSFNQMAKTPAHLLKKAFDIAVRNAPHDYNLSNWTRHILAHPNTDPAMIADAVERATPAQAPSLFASLIQRPNLPAGIAERIVERANQIAPPVRPMVIGPNGRPQHPPQTTEAQNMANFWERYARSNYVKDEWLKNTFKEMNDQQAVIDNWNQQNPTNPYAHHWKYEPLHEILNEVIGQSDPDAKYQTKVSPKIGSHPFRKLRDLIESIGGQLHISEIQKHPIFKKIPVDKARVARDMTPEEYEKKFAKVPPAKRPPPGPGLRVKTDFVSSEGVQGLIDSMPESGTWNVSTEDWAKYRGQMSHPSATNKVFQLNVTTDMINKMKEAGVLDVFRKLQQGPIRGGTLHPMTGDTIGWLRYYPVSPEGTVTIDEIQSDIRPPGGSWVMALKGANGQLPGQNGRGWQGQAINNVVRNSMWGGNFPAEKMDKVMEILAGGKKRDIHEVILEAFHQHLRDQGHHNVKVFMPDVGMQASMRYGWSGLPADQRAAFPIPPSDQDLNRVGGQNAPEHMYDTHSKIPESLGYDMRSTTYGATDETGHRDSMQPNQRHEGWPMHTTKVMKKEDMWDLVKGIETLPSLPFVRSVGGDRIYDASHYLSQEHRGLGYKMHIRTGHGQYGKYSIAEVFHGGTPVGGASAYIDDQKIADGKPEKAAQLDMVGLKDGHTGRGLGLHMYEALLASAKSHWGCTKVRGLHHSSMAHSVHKRLADKHGLDYSAAPNFPSSKYADEPAWASAPNQALDAKWGPYSYSF